jgi:hypothetical protein
MQSISAIEKTKNFLYNWFSAMTRHSTLTAEKRVLHPGARRIRQQSDEFTLEQD